MPSTRRTRSALINDSENKAIFGDEKPPKIDFEIEPDVDWVIVKTKLFSIGFDWKHGSGLSSYKFVLPHHDKLPKEERKANRDYFNDEETFKEYVRQKYGWIGPTMSHFIAHTFQF